MKVTPIKKNDPFAHPHQYELKSILRLAPDLTLEIMRESHDSFREILNLDRALSRMMIFPTNLVRNAEYHNVLRFASCCSSWIRFRVAVDQSRQGTVLVLSSYLERIDGTQMDLETMTVPSCVEYEDLVGEMTVFLLHSARHVKENTNGSTQFLIRRLP